jgi:hypothetical protein
MKKETILTKLATVAPQIAIETIWEHDPDAPFSEITRCFDDPDPDDWQAWQTEVRASIIVGGKLVTGSAYLGGIWERYGDNPEKAHPEIFGYFLQMTREALEELRDTVGRDHVSAAFAALY